MQTFSNQNAVDTSRKGLLLLQEQRPEMPRHDKMVPALLFPYKQTLEVEDVTETILQKVEQALCWQWPMAALCQHAGITQSVYNKLRKIPELQERFDVLKQRPENISRRNIAMEIEAGDIPTSKWFLERRTKDFAPKQQIDYQVTQNLDEGAVVSSLAKLVELSRERAAEAKMRQADIIEMDQEYSDPLLQ